MDKNTKFWDKIAPKYARSPVSDEESYQRKLEITQGYFRPDFEVLEFGCGTGSTALVHAPHVRHIRATDLSGEMLAIAREKAEAAGISNVVFEQTSIEALDAQEESYDVVLGMSILHLLEDRQAAIAKVWRLLKPGGVFVSSTACIGDMSMLFRPVIPIGRLLGLVPFVSIFKIDQLVADIEAAGFTIDHQWCPGKNKAVFIVAIKPEA